MLYRFLTTDSCLIERSMPFVSMDLYLKAVHDYIDAIKHVSRVPDVPLTITDIDKLREEFTEYLGVDLEEYAALMGTTVFELIRSN